jgi:hypothetical protein
MSTARSITLYIEPKTLKRLRLAIKLYPLKISTGGDPVRSVTVDELANQLLNEVIVRQFPLVRDLEKVLSQAEQDFLTTHEPEKEQQQ